MSSSSERLFQLTEGIDLIKNPSVTSTILREVLADLKAERSVQAKEKARQIMLQCIELEKKKRQAKKEFEAAEQKFDKELGKLLSQLERDVGGQPVAPADEVVEEPTTE